MCKKLREAAEKGFVKEVLEASPTPERKPQKGARVTATYRGCLPSGKEFDKSGPEGFTFSLGAGEVIRGWDEGIATMAVGERALLYLSAPFAYGARGAPPDIPPNYPLIFEIQLLSFQ